jgi:hypothetical protein
MEPRQAFTIAALVVFVPIGAAVAYFSGYFLGCDVYRDPAIIVRIYAADWQVQVFRPGARVESIFSGKAVELATQADLVPPQ